MSDIAVRVDNLSKLYRIGSSPANRTFREMLTDGLTAPFRRAGKNGNGRKKEFWALKDVSFEVKRGEVVGIIGRNGAGKSTLLKILSRITEPTGGHAEIHGRVGSLLEVGTGFHPELTGRENIYLNGAILGMKRREIDRKFDEIVDFAEVEQFIDTPVKHYSSGMYVRLAFAVAAHLEPEILIVDEVLAVGDAAFQKKCLGKMGDVAREGRTVLFVSHNMLAVQRLCTTGVLLSRGRLNFLGPAQNGVQEYFGEIEPFNGATGTDLANIERSGRLRPVLRNVRLRNELGNSTASVLVGETLVVELSYSDSKPIRDPSFGIIVETYDGTRVFWVNSKLQVGDWPTINSFGVVTCRIPRMPLIPGKYYLTIGCRSGNQQLDYVERVASVDILEDDVFGTGYLPQPNQGLVIVDANWHMDESQPYVDN